MPTPRARCGRAPRARQIALVAFACTLPAIATAQTHITLRLADSVPATHPISVNGTKFWMDEVKRRTNGQVDFQWYPAEQLGKAKDLLALTQSGTVEVGRFGASYTPEKLPLTAAEELPGMINSSCEGSEALWNLTKASGNGFLAKTEYAPLHLKVVFAFSNAPYEVQTTKARQVKLPTDMKGLKLKTLGGASDEAARRVGAIPVQMSVADLFLSLQRGTVDGRFGAFGSVKANSTENVLKYSTDGAQIGSFAAIGAISDTVWNRLPQNVRDAMMAAGDATWKNFCTQEDAASGRIRKELEEKNGWVVHDLTREERNAWRETLRPVQEIWARDVDKNGKAGTGALQAMRAEIDRLRAAH